MFRAGGQRLRGAVGVIIARVEEVCRSAADGSECCGHRQEEGQGLCETVVCKRRVPTCMFGDDRGSSCLPRTLAH